MRKSKFPIYHFFIPLLLALLLFGSNFLNTNIFSFGDNSFAVWFVLLTLCFACGWYINRTLLWNLGGKVIFATIVTATLISLVSIITFREYFFAKELLTENLILYSLRNITLGAFSFFGMAVAEILILQKDFAVLTEKVRIYENVLKNANSEAEFKIKEAKLEANKLLSEAKLETKDVQLKKERIKKELQNFIQIEKELIRKYESL